ncbi:MAG: hypothetical protein NW241_14560 [Bacteroidia bacterium]|nr:hypothetical protein [Bacteroidia bacterium]
MPALVRILIRYRFWALLGIGLAVRLLYIALTGADGLLSGDAQEYYDEAVRMYRGEGSGGYWPPGLPMYLALCFHLSGGPSLAAAAGGMLLWYIALMALLDSQLRQAPWQRRWLIPGVIALYPAMVYHSVAPLTHLPVAVLVLGLYAVLTPRSCRRDVAERPPLNSLLAGSFAALATLIRPAALALAAISSAWRLARPHPDWLRGRLLPAALLMLPVMLALGAWQFAQSRSSDRNTWLNEANSYNFFIGNNPWTPLYRTWWLGSHDERGHPYYAGYYALRDETEALPPAERQRRFSRLAWSHIRERPGLFMMRTFSRIRTFFAFDTLAGASMYRRKPIWGFSLLAGDAVCYLTLLLLAVWNLANWLPPRTPEVKLLLLLIGGYALPYFIAFSHPTYHLPVMPLIALLAAPRMQTAAAPRWSIILPVVLIAAIQAEWVLNMLFSLYTLPQQ